MNKNHYQMKRIFLLCVLASFTGLWALATDCGAFRAYFKPVTFNPAVTTLSIVIEGATSVADVKQQQKDGKTDVYDLQGRKITNSQQSKASGIYISNGKKVIIL